MSTAGGTAWQDTMIQCPYYRSSDKMRRSITCEGILDRSTQTITFFAEAEWKAQRKTFCCGEAWERCVYAHMVEHYKYPEKRT